MKLSKGKLILFIAGSGIIVVLLIFLLPNKSPEILDEDRFVDIYVELSVISEQYRNNPLGFEKEKKRILEGHKITQDDLNDFVKHYKRTPEKWIGVWKKIVKKLCECTKREGKSGEKQTSNPGGS